MSCACQLINYMLATEENFRNVQVCACCNHFPITCNEFYHNTQPNNFEYCTRYIFQRLFLGKISAILSICIMKKNNNLEVLCKWKHIGFWNLCKRLPNFINVAALAEAILAVE